jgi:hypothetical protein
VAKYDPLHTRLKAKAGSGPAFRMTFEDVIRLVRDLPPSATKHRAWWANDPTHVHVRAWLDAGWEGDTVGQKAGVVTFRGA